MNNKFVESYRIVTDSGKIGTINYLRNDSYEKSIRLEDPTHYYYCVDFDDDSFETYMSEKEMIFLDELESLKFRKGYKLL